jgi:hypothetical protein
MAAMTVFPLVMACGVIALVAMPFGLEGTPLWLMSQLLEFMLRVADYVGSQRGAVGHVKASSPWVIGLYGFGFAMLCLGQIRTRVAGALCALVAIALWVSAPVYDVRIDSKGRVSVRTDSGINATSNLRADRYGRDQFTRASGEGVSEWASYRDDVAACDALGCRLVLGKATISVVEAPSEVPEACETSDIVILAERSAGPVARRGCDAVLLDRLDLLRTDGVHINTKEPTRIVPVRSEVRARRPWG